MKKLALVFVLAVFGPSLVLAWLAVHSARDQQIIVAQQQTLLYQGIADSLAKEVRDFMARQQRDFAQLVESLRRDHPPAELASQFDKLLLRGCPAAEVGFTVSADGSVLSPSLFDRPEARQFRLNNDRFLGSCETVAVYWNSPKPSGPAKTDDKAARQIGLKMRPGKNDLTLNSNLTLMKEPMEALLEPEEADFKQLVGDNYEGTVARFLQNKLRVFLWYRSVREPEMIYGAQLNLSNIVAGITPLIRAPESVSGEVAVALLNDTDRVLAGPRREDRPFVLGEIGQVLPHWKIALHLLHPESLTRNAQSLKLTLTLIVLVMIAAIAVGSLLIARDLRRQLTLARQKTDFVSNVSHELKTPLTSIRMFSELLSEGKAADDNQRRHFLNIINCETARLTRLINNVLDFARLERGENSPVFTDCDLRRLVESTVATCQPQLSARGLKLNLHLPDQPLLIRGDADALAQVLVNLLSNAEKYAAGGQEVTVELECSAKTRASKTGGGVCLRIMDRGPGVPKGCEEKIFEQFYRAHDSLSSGIQGSGLGLTLARKLVRAHGGELSYAPRVGGGSCFEVILPLVPPQSGSGIPA